MITSQKEYNILRKSNIKTFIDSSDTIVEMELLFFNEITTFGLFMSLKDSKTCKANAISFFFLETAEELNNPDNPIYLIELTGTKDEIYLGNSMFWGLNKFTGFFVLLINEIFKI